MKKPNDRTDFMRFFGLKMVESVLVNEFTKYRL